MTSGRVLIAPSILTADFGRLAEQVRAAEEGGADLFHLDVMDGHFVPRITFGDLVLETVRRHTSLPIEVHLMVDNPEVHFEPYGRLGAQRMLFHYEAARNLEATRATLERLRALGLESGVAINPETRAEALFPLLGEMDEAVVMLIQPGRGGQQMQPELLDKVRLLRERARAQGLDLPIEVDGGVKAHNARDCVAAGATVLVAGSSTYNDDQTPQQALAELRAAVEG